MGAFTRLATMLERSSIDRVVKEQVETKLKEEKLKEAGSETTSEDVEDRNWKQITARGQKSFSPLEQDKMQRICYYLFDKNGLAKKAIEHSKNYCLGDGATFSCPDPEVNEVLLEHWNSPQNFWDYKQDRRFMELRLYGEQFYPTFVNDVSGAVELGYIDPVLVTKVTTDPKNVEKRVSFDVTFTGSVEPKTFQIINLDQNSASPTYGYLVGEAFFFEINNVTNFPRGRSDLFTAADGIDAYEFFLFNRAERADILNRIIYDVEWKGATDTEIKKRAKEWDIPRANEANHHNENMSWKIVSPDLGSEDATGEARLILNHTMACLGYPPTWFASGEGLTKGTAGLMDGPTKKQLRAQQKTFRFVLSYILRYVVHQAVIHKRLNPKQKDTPIEIHLPVIEEREIEVVSSSLSNIVSALSVAVDSEFIEVEQAKAIFNMVLSEFGRKVDTIKKDASTISNQVEDKTRKLYQSRGMGIPKKNDKEENEDGED